MATGRQASGGVRPEVLLGLSRNRHQLECWKMEPKQTPPQPQQTFTLLIISVFLYISTAYYPNLRSTIVCRMIQCVLTRYAAHTSHTACINFECVNTFSFT